jgi:hypothetical protein
MCEYESNILKLIMEDKERLAKLYVDKNASYMKSLDHGIQTAKEKLAMCQEKQCMAEIYKQNRDLIPVYDFRKWAQIKADMIQCVKPYE